MIKILFFSLTFIAVSLSSSGQKKAQYEITGKLTGFADSTWIYLDKTDSVQLKDGAFRFSGSLKEEVKRVMLRTVNYSDYKFFWLENAVINFNAEKGKFREAVIIGSGPQDEQNQLIDAIKLSGKEKEESILFIKNHPNSIISANVLNVYASTWGKDTTELLYRNLSKKNKSGPYGLEIAEFIRLNKNVKVGDKYIDFTEPNTEGRKVSLSDFHGKIVLLEFWGSWCGPCRQGNPELVEIYNSFKSKGFDILGVAADDKKEFWIDAVQNDKLPWQNVSDLKGDKNKASLIYGISYYPANFLIDQNGIIIAKDLRGADLRNKLQEILN